MNLYSKRLLAYTAALLVASCNSMDDQTIVKKERNYLANPSPVKRDFARINAQHKVLVGIIDTGVDYNHPLLMENIHFKLNTLFSWPTSHGYDVSAQDEWASPNIVRTSDYNPEMKKEDRAKSIEDAQFIFQLVRAHPEFSSFLHPYRHVAQEIQASAYHGTHVAGLASYDNPQIGILGYRVLPFSTKYKDGKAVKMDTGDIFIDQILEGSERAVQDGARVLNMSLGMLVERNYKSKDESLVNEQKHKERIQKLREFALANPDVVIVVAAGNDGKWMDQDARLGMPCGTQAPNILCVGATEENGKVASFTNLLLTEGAFILGYGVNAVSTMPPTMCMSQSVSGLVNTRDNIKTKDQYDVLVQRLKEECKDLELKPLSGTSMASPIIARQIAMILIENPKLTGAQAIRALLAKTSPYKMGPVSFPSLRVKKPSWAKSKETLLRQHSMRKLDLHIEEDEYFDFIVPVQH